MAARLLFHKKQLYRDGIVEMVIWQLPQADAERPHGLKYRLVYVREGKRIVGYDNERGKGDHKHIADQELPYRFSGVRDLVRDFWTDVRRCSDE
jgi:Family of unknown function (DUF6516)